MVTKTDPCAYSEFRIYPGKGCKWVARNGTVSFFISKKCYSLFSHRIKPVKLTWTHAWRRYNKKTKTDEHFRKRSRKTTRVQKAIVGMSLDEIKRRRAEKPEEREKKMEAAKKEVKDRQKKKVDAKKATAPKKVTKAAWHPRLPQSKREATRAAKSDRS
jgi:large subunit ribosomal protein L24e